MTYLIVDLNSIASVAYYADKSNKFNFFNMVNRALDVTGTFSVIFAADCPGKYWRHDIYPDYKANRKSDPDRTAYISLLVEKLKQAGYPVLMQDKLEADDIIASLPTPNWVFTKDRDLWQLWPQSNILAQDYTIVNNDMCLAKFGVSAANLPQFKAMRGDPGDNLPGIKGIGDKTAARLLTEYGSIGSIYANLDKLPKGIRTKLKQGQPAKWFKLITLRKVELTAVAPKLVTDRFQLVVDSMRDGS